ncbi:MAG: hypothetical protein A2177_14360 [Spirochaetes bacterium RBG_13_68_11]|nr:MAG: hypothetical protein A2177_14360 [Spirochaetes bacterium RBG_13_68_11]
MALSGASLGFVCWSAIAAGPIFRSYLFDNSLPERARIGLLAAIAIGAVVLPGAWMSWGAAFRRGTREPAAVLRRTAPFFSLGIVLWFAPFLAVPAIEVYHPWLTYCLVLGVALGTLGLAVWAERAAGRGSGSEDSRLRDSAPSADRICTILLAVFTVGYGAFFSVYTVMKHLAFHSYAFDLGWQNQVFDTLLRTGNPRATGYITIDHFSLHFQPLYYLLAPFYALHRDPTTLLVLQAVALPVAAVPLYLVARRRLGNPWLSLTVAAVFLLYPALHGLNTYDFHGVVLLIPIASFALYFLETGAMPLFWVFLALGLITREDTAVTLSGIGLYAWFVLGKRRLGVAVLAACVGYFLLALTIMSALGGYANLENYWALTLPDHQNFAGVVLTLISNPLYAFRHVFLNVEKLQYLLLLLLPVGFLPLASGKNAVVVLPGLAVILLSGTSAQYSIGFQYSAHLIPFVFFLAICGIQAIMAQKRAIGALALAAPLLVSGAVMDYEYGLVFAKRFPGFLRPDERERTAYSLFREIPREDPVATISRLYPHLSSRTEIYLLQRMQPATEWVLADLAPPSPASDLYEAGYRGHTLSPREDTAIVLSLIDRGTFGVARYENGFVLLRRGLASELTARVRDEIAANAFEPRDELIPYYRDPAAATIERERSPSDRFLAFLRSNRYDTIILAVKGDAMKSLSYLCAKLLLDGGSRINTLRRGGSYAAVVRDGTVLWEEVANGRAIDTEATAARTMEQLFPGHQVRIRSAGTRQGNDCAIVIDGRDEAPKEHGMNAVVLDRGLAVLGTAAFDTGR